MDEPGRVDLFESVQDGQDDGQQFVLRQVLAAGEEGLQAFPVLISHDHVGRIVGLEDGEHLHDIRVFETRERLALVDEPAQTPVEVFLVLVRECPDRTVFPAHGEVGRQVLLDGHLHLQVGVVCEVGNTESTLAQYALDFVPVDPEAGFERVAGACRGHEQI